MAVYFPFASGRYEVSPGLIPFGQDLGNGQEDRRLFQFDDSFAGYHAAKREARSQDIGKYYVKKDLDPAAEEAVVRFIIDRLAQERPAEFVKTPGMAGGVTLDCLRTGDRIALDGAGRYAGGPYLDALDALAFQVQEDLAIWRRDGEREWLAAAHLCFPNHWSPGEKVGLAFAQVHEPVGDFAAVNRAPLRIVDTMIRKGPFVRFAWGLATDTRLNHHPQPPAAAPGIVPGSVPESAAIQEWHGRRFNPDRPALSVRVERQTLWPFPVQDAALFTIRTYFHDVAAMGSNHLAKLSSALSSMSPAARRYKGLTESFDAIQKWIAAVAASKA